MTGKRSSLDGRYFKWLYSKIASVREKDPKFSHHLLAEQLFKLEFYWDLPNDDNRAADGLALRDEFYSTLTFEEDPTFDAGFDPHYNCTLLEMLIALSRRLQYESTGLGIITTSPEWFWKMISNLGLLDYYDQYFIYNEFAAIEVAEICEIFWNRTYDYNGQGGLFPLKFPKENQREVELWYQMSAYLLENSDLNV